MPIEYPKFRDDLIISQQQYKDVNTYVIKDPITRRFFQFKQREFFIAMQLDGKTSPIKIQQKFYEEFGISLPNEKLDQFIKHLRALGFLESDLTEREISRAQHQIALEQNYFQRLLYIKLKTLDPNRIFDTITPHIEFFFTKQFVLLAAVATIWAIVITISNWEDYTTQVKDLIKAGTVPTLLLAVFTVTILHECAHGLTCKRYGGSVHEIGFLLIFFLPAFYCDVSDAWLFKDKRKRLWVSFAGIFFQIFLWSLATIVWRIIDLETWLSEFCCLVMATSGLTALFNLTPLLKLDGYYLMVDYLEIPNLRKRAFNYLGSQLKGWFRPVPEKPPQINKRERRIYLLYGLLAGLYSVGLLAVIFWKVAGFIFSRLHATGLILLLAISLIVFTGALERWALKIYNAVKTKRGLNMRRKRTVVMLAIIAAFILITIFGKWELKIANKSELLPSSMACIRAEVDGMIQEIFFEEGDTVKANEVIARLDDTEYRAEMIKTEAEIAKCQATLELLKEGPSDEEVDRLTKLVEKARTRVLFAKKDFERITELYENNLVPHTEYAKANEELSVRMKDLEHAQSDLNVLLSGHRPEEIKAAEAELARLNTSHEFLEEQVERTQIVSPIPGVVSAYHLKDKLKEHLSVGDEICQIVNCRTLLLEMPVSEKDIVQVKAGQRVKFRARSIPKIAFHGKVVAIAPVASNNKNQMVFIVTSELDNHDSLLRPGMTGHAKIYCGKRSFIYLWTRKIIRFIRVEFWW